MISKKEFLQELFNGNLKINFRGKITKDDKVDAATLAYTPLIEKLINKEITDADIDTDILRAFKLQYPNEGSFIANVKEHAHNPEELQGLLNGVKGKLFEIEVEKYFNDGNLHDGLHAELASSPTQPGYDILIVNNQTLEVEDRIQVKATDNLEYVKDALEKNPEIEIISTTEITQKINETNLSESVSDIGISDSSLENQLSDSVDTIQADHIDFLIPIPTLGIIAISSLSQLRKGDNNEVIIDRTIERTSKSIVSYYTGKLFLSLSGIPIVGVLASVGSRLLFGKINFERKKIQFYENVIQESQNRQNELRQRREKLQKYLE